MLAPPAFSRFQQSLADALILTPGAYGNLRNVDIDHFSMHCIRRLIESGVYESNDFTVEFRD